MNLTSTVRSNIIHIPLDRDQHGHRIELAASNGVIRDIRNANHSLIEERAYKLIRLIKASSNVCE